MIRKTGVALIVVVCILMVGAGTAVAQDTTSNATTTTNGSADQPDGERFYGDDEIRISSWSYEGETFTITFHSTREKLVTMTAEPIGSGTGASPGRVRQVWVGPGKSTVQMKAPTGVVWLSTRMSTANNRYTELSASPDTHLLAGPFSGADVRNAGLGGALGVVIAVLYEATAAKIGASERGERVA